MAQSKKTFVQEIRNNIYELLELENDFEFSLEEPPQNFNADLSTNVVLLLAKKEKTNPKTLSEGIIKKLEKAPYFSKIEFVPPGFLNFHISKELLESELEKVLAQGDKYPEIDLYDGNPVLIDFVSSNPTGPLHIGHGRGAVIGDALARIYTQLGFKILKEYYVNDVGVQMNFLAQSVELQAKIIKSEDVSSISTEKLYKGTYIAEIAKKLLEEYRDKIPEISVIKEFAVTEILKDIRSDLAEFKVEFDSWQYESELHNKGIVKKVVEGLHKDGFLFEKDSALWFKTEDSIDEKDRVIQKQDGRYTYFGADIAYHWYKFERGYKKLLNIWGCDHHGYVPRIKSAMLSIGHKPEDVEVLLYQLVSLSRNGERVRMSTRAGEFVTLREVREEIGTDAARYFLSTKTPGTHLEFDLELAKKKANENPIFYIQYAHTRCCGILREAEKTQSISAVSKIDYSLLKENLEHQIIKKITLYPDVLHRCIKNLSPITWQPICLILPGYFTDITTLTA
ncbi:MAG: arginine--tRNA ligase [Elusimicrobia bacterium]|nr:arginine--tRNA ligase [Elusimicrobiota bacterium]